MRAQILSISLAVTLSSALAFAQAPAIAAPTAPAAAGSGPATIALPDAPESTPLTVPQPILNGQWPNVWAQVSFLDQQKALKTYVYSEKLQLSEWGDVNEKMATLLAVPKLNVSPEYVSYRMGAVSLFGPAIYGKSPSEMRAHIDPAAPVWLTLIQPRDMTETNCMTLSVQKGKVQGCGDVWQGGLTNDKLACYQGKTYVKCHLECIKTIYKRQLATTAGACEPAK